MEESVTYELNAAGLPAKLPKPLTDKEKKAAKVNPNPTPYPNPSVRANPTPTPTSNPNPTPNPNRNSRQRPRTEVDLTSDEEGPKESWNMTPKVKGCMLTHHTVSYTHLTLPTIYSA